MVKTFMDNAKIAPKISLDYSSRLSPTPEPVAETSPEAVTLLNGLIPLTSAGLRLDVALARLFPEYSRARLQAWLGDGLIHIDGVSPAPTHKVHGGEVVCVFQQVLPSSQEQAEAIDLNIAFEDDELVVINKPAGLVVHPGNGNATGTMLNALLHYLPSLEALPRAGIVHRLDKDTSGLLVVAKSLTAQTDLVRQLQGRTVKRHYMALVHGDVFGDGVVDAAIGRHPVQRTKMAIVRGGGREARTHYFVRERFAKACLLECRLETGRTHQIRVHMTSIGHPLVGDKVYGKPKSSDPRLDAFSRQALHAWQLSLIHPQTKQEISWQSELPADFESLLFELQSD
jgi:23S rRNA pseudouridine1911/1915/1917 synthase